MALNKHSLYWNKIFKKKKIVLLLDNHTGTTVTSSITSTLTAPTKLDKQYLFQRMVVNFTNATIIK